MITDKIIFLMHFKLTALKVRGNRCFWMFVLFIWGLTIPFSWSEAALFIPLTVPSLSCLCSSIRSRMPGTMWTRRSSCWAAMMRATTSRQGLRSTRSVVCLHMELRVEEIPLLHCACDTFSILSLTAAAYGRSDAPADTSTKPPHDARLHDATWAGHQWSDGKKQACQHCPETGLTNSVTWIPVAFRVLLFWSGPLSLDGGTIWMFCTVIFYVLYFYKGDLQAFSPSSTHDA